MRHKLRWPARTASCWTRLPAEFELMKVYETRRAMLGAGVV